MWGQGASWRRRRAGGRDARCPSLPASGSGGSNARVRARTAGQEQRQQAAGGSACIRPPHSLLLEGKHIFQAHAQGGGQPALLPNIKGRRNHVPQRVVAAIVCGAEAAAAAARERRRDSVRPRLRSALPACGGRRGAGDRCSWAKHAAGRGSQPLLLAQAPYCRVARAWVGRLPDVGRLAAHGRVHGKVLDVDQVLRDAAQHARATVLRHPLWRARARGGWAGGWQVVGWLAGTWCGAWGALGAAPAGRVQPSPAAQARHRRLPSGTPSQALLSPQSDPARRCGSTTGVWCGSIRSPSAGARWGCQGCLPAEGWAEGLARYACTGGHRPQSAGGRCRRRKRGGLR